ncbi:hypothetical protein [Paraburkholderia terricola]|uniref:hypothetical protein n=1 Tax=Paraburkholderia terricola TaxID=169427 RepID=UPI001FD1F054|nr:hypothetical protein [Paraburkholderia terricola]
MKELLRFALSNPALLILPAVGFVVSLVVLSIKRRYVLSGCAMRGGLIRIADLGRLAVLALEQGKTCLYARPDGRARSPGDQDVHLETTSRLGVVHDSVIPMAHFRAGGRHPTFCWSRYVGPFWTR